MESTPKDEMGMAEMVKRVCGSANLHNEDARCVDDSCNREQKRMDESKGQWTGKLNMQSSCECVTSRKNQPSMRSSG